MTADAATPPRPNREIARVAAALIGFALGYALVPFAHLQNVFYDPLAHGWFYGRPNGPIPMGYVGLCLHGALGAAFFTLISSLLFRRELTARAAGLAAAWALTMLMLTVGYYTWNNWP